MRREGPSEGDRSMMSAGIRAEARVAKKYAVIPVKNHGASRSRNVRTTITKLGHVNT
jgi:hypothetical protein